MSTYLVAIVVSEFQCRENNGRTFGVCSRPKAMDQTEYSFAVGQKTLDKFDEILDYKYNRQMSKLHMIAIPDFVSGAMENWGKLFADFSINLLLLFSVCVLFFFFFAYNYSTIMSFVLLRFGDISRSGSFV